MLPRYFSIKSRLRKRKEWCEKKRERTNTRGPDHEILQMWTIGAKANDLGVQIQRQTLIERLGSEKAPFVPELYDYCSNIGWRLKP